MSSAFCCAVKRTTDPFPKRGNHEGESGRRLRVTDFQSVAVEYDEFRDARFEASMAAAEAALDALVDRLLAELATDRIAAQ